ncbi:hypothetical protein OPAG_01753 [Rhodococcus opacus PD630]|uniref:N-acyl homoserine lactonase family protein n=1 Tax=Rhodococcus opacus TaxID=37919 RepID=UPI00029CB014|nr:N-acyl homoserine lactonase family protein [Rhodococcus opacus]EHI39502.1 hypothetical protein OPAG_01753 [Rhodococcus opacus PD630]UDG96736.1 N-acyl homoserine lactonase family protein [Rhodococcus opacus PD630]
MSDTSTEVYALRYATRPNCMTSEAFYRHDLYGETDTPVGMDYFFWLIRSQGQTVVVDCGFNENVGPTRNRWISTTPSELLSRMGVDPKAVDHVVLSHMHFDHVGNTHLFPNATFHMSRAEYEYWTGRHRDVPAFSWPVESDEVRLLESLRREERLELVDESGEVGTSGARITRYAGHTPGQVVTDIDIDHKKVLLAADAVHYYDEIRRKRPFYLFTDLEQMLDSYDSLRLLDERPDVDVIPGHDPAVSAGYVEVDKDCFDLTTPLVALPRDVVDADPVNG